MGFPVESVAIDPRHSSDHGISALIQPSPHRSLIRALRTAWAHGPSVGLPDVEIDEMGAEEAAWHFSQDGEVPRRKLSGSRGKSGAQSTCPLPLQAQGGEEVKRRERCKAGSRGREDHQNIEILMREFALLIFIFSMLFLVANLEK